VHVVACEIETDQTLEYDGPPWPSGGEKDKEASCCAAVGYHVQDGAKCSGLVVVPRCVAVEGVEDAGNAVEEGTGSWV